MATNPEKPKFSIKLPEIPKGEELYTKSIQLAQRAILLAYPPNLYPIMEEKKEKILPLDRIHIRPRHQIIGLEQQHKPADDILLYRAVILAGLPEEEAKKRLYTTLQGFPYYLDRHSFSMPELYIAEDATEPLDSSNPVERGETAIRIAQYYIDNVLRVWVEPQEALPNVHDLMKMMAKHYVLDHILLDIERNSPTVNKQTIEQVKDLIFSILDTDQEAERPRYVALGGRLMVLLPGQTLATAEFGTGYVFDMGVRCYLAVPIIRNLLDLLRGNFMLDSSTNYFVPDTILKQADMAVLKLESLSLRERNKTVEAYFNSDLPFLITASDNPKLDIRHFLL